MENREQPNDPHLYVLIGQLSGKVDSILTAIQANRAGLGVLEIRVNKLEQAKAYIIGLAATSGGVAALVTKFITNLQ